MGNGVADLVVAGMLAPLGIPGPLLMLTYLLLDFVSLWSGETIQDACVLVAT